MAGLKLEITQTLGAGWVHLIQSVWALPANARIQARFQSPDDCSADVEEVLITGSDYYWDNSPVSTIREFGAEPGKVWKLTGVSDVKDEDGGTILYKGEISDDNIVYTPIDAAWKTIAQANTNAAAGLYDNHQYVRFLTQLNSDGTQQPNITSFTLSGTKTALIPDHAIQQVEVVIKPKQIEISKPSKLVEVSKSSKLIEVPWDI